MLMQIISQFRRRPVPALAVVLFAVVISFALGGLQRSNDTERESYENTFQTTPVSFSVTDLYGEDINSIADPIRGWIADTFTGAGVSEPYLVEYVADLKMELSWHIDGELSGYSLTGITSAATAPLLDSDCGGKVTWFDGYDESILERTFEDGDLFCVIPDTLYETLEPGTQELKVEFTDHSQGEFLLDGSYRYKMIHRKLVIAGTYESLKQEYTIYCPFGVARRVLSELGKPTDVTSISGLLKDNYRLEEFRTVAASWFAEPNSTGEKTLWNRWGWEYYLYALDIDDTVLQRVTRNYQISIFINEMSSMLVLAFCTAAGFMIGFLLIRSRKREIGLMRTLGGSNFHIYLGFAAEQFLCIAAGIALGGALMDFNAPKQLALFALVYFVGLSAALSFFLNKNLLSGLKEDE